MTTIEVWYSAKYDEYTLREFDKRFGGCCTGYEWRDGISEKRWNQMWKDYEVWKYIENAKWVEKTKGE